MLGGRAASRPSEGDVLAALARRDSDATPSSAGESRKKKRRRGSPEPARRSGSSSGPASRSRPEPGGDDDGDDEGESVTMLKLKAVEGPFRGVKFEIDPAGASVGRMQIATPTFARKLHEVRVFNCLHFPPFFTRFRLNHRRSQLHLPDNDVSRKHAKIEFSSATDCYVIRDLNSTNGVKVNGEKIAAYEEASLKKGDRLELGQSVFEVRLKQATVFAWEREKATRRELAHRKAEVKVPRLTREERAAIPRRDVPMDSLTKGSASRILGLPAGCKQTLQASTAT